MKSNKHEQSRRLAYKISSMSPYEKEYMGPGRAHLREVHLAIPSSCKIKAPYKPMPLQPQACSSQRTCKCSPASCWSSASSVWPLVGVSALAHDNAIHFTHDWWGEVMYSWIPGLHDTWIYEFWNPGGRVGWWMVGGK